MRFSSGFWRKCRVGFRWLRIATWLAVLVSLCGLLWLNRVGLPDFLKRPLVARLEAHGVDLQFTRLRVRFTRGLVAENVIAGLGASKRSEDGQGSTPVGPTLSAAEVQLELDYSALWHRRLEIRGLGVRQGEFTWPAAPTNGLTLDHIQADLRFQTNDTWSVDHFAADFADANIAVTGEIAHASEMRNWSIFHPAKPSAPAKPPAAWQQFSETVGQIHFKGGTLLDFSVNGDALDLRSFVVRATARTRGVQTPWGATSNIFLAAYLAVPSNSQLLGAAKRSEDGSTLNSQLFSGWWTNLEPYCLNWTVNVNQLQAGALSAPSIGAAGSAFGPDLIITNLFLALPQGRVAAQARVHLTADWPRLPIVRLDFNAPLVATSQGSVRDLHFAANVAMATNSQLLGAAKRSEDGSTLNSQLLIGWWTNLPPCHINWTLQLAQLQYVSHSFQGKNSVLQPAPWRSATLNVNALTCAGSWLAPELTVSDFSARLGGGGLDAAARLNLASRRLVFTNHACFDPNVVAALLPVQAQKWLTQVSWQQPPSFAASGVVTLPGGTNGPVSWREAWRWPAFLAGNFAATNAAWRGLALDSVQAHFGRSNMLWSLADLVLVRTNGALALTASEDDTTRNFQCHVRGALDLNAVRPLLTNSAARAALDLVSLTAPPSVDLDLRGCLRDFSSVVARGSIQMTNFTIRGEAVEVFQTGAAYSNRVLNCFTPSLVRREGRMSADGITVDFNAQRIHFVNGLSTADPQAVAHAIGPVTDRDLAPYRFLAPPVARVNGYAPLRGDRDADLTFDVDGGPFAWMKLNSPHVAGQVRWLGEVLILTNVTASLYGGQGAGYANFDFSVPHRGADYQLGATFTNLSLHLLASDLGSPTNRLEGALSGAVVITHADTRDWRTPDGYGRVAMRDGLLWDIPLFGVLSPVLNAFSPNLGSSRATEAHAVFFITNGVIQSDTVEIRTMMMRLQYAGTTDLQGNVNARVTAQLLRNTWVVGPLISAVLWPVSKLFEYQVSGTLDHPQIKPIHSRLLMPLHPIRSLEELFPSGDLFNNPPPGK